MFGIGSALVTPNDEGRDVFLRGELCRAVVEEGGEDCELIQTCT